MKEKIIKNILKIIILILSILVVFLAIKNIPSSFLEDNKTQVSKVQQIEKINDGLSPMAPGSVFDTAGEVGHLVSGNGYTRVVAESVAKQIYCAMKGGSLNASGYTYEQVESFKNSLIGRTYRMEQNLWTLFIC